MKFIRNADGDWDVWYRGYQIGSDFATLSDAVDFVKYRNG